MRTITCWSTETIKIEVKEISGLRCTNRNNSYREYQNRNVIDDLKALSYNNYVSNDCIKQISAYLDVDICKFQLCFH